MKTMRTLCYAGVVAAISVTTLPNLASAQNAMTIEEVVVTARKKEEKLQDIPMTGVLPRFHGRFNCSSSDPI